MPFPQEILISALWRGTGLGHICTKNAGCRGPQDPVRRWAPEDGPAQVSPVMCTTVLSRLLGNWDVQELEGLTDARAALVTHIGEVPPSSPPPPTTGNTGYVRTLGLSVGDKHPASFLCNLEQSAGNLESLTLSLEQKQFTFTKRTKPSLLLPQWKDAKIDLKRRRRNKKALLSL